MKSGCDYNDAVSAYISFLYSLRNIREFLGWWINIDEQLECSCFRSPGAQQHAFRRENHEGVQSCFWCLSFGVSSDWVFHSEENQMRNLKRKGTSSTCYLLANLVVFLKRNTEKQDTITLQGTSDEKVASSASHTSTHKRSHAIDPIHTLASYCSLTTLSTHEVEST